MNNNPVCLEIIDASKILGVNQESLLNPKIKMDIFSTEDLLKIFVVFKFSDSESVYAKNIANNFNVPVMEASLI